MSEPFIGELRMFSFAQAPRGWALCNGQLLPISQNQPLFSLLGTRYGGDGRVTFALPDLRGRVPIGFGDAQHLVQGTRGGVEAHTLTQSEMPAHTHAVQASQAFTGGTSNPNGAFLGGAANVYHAPVNLTAMSPQTVTNRGGSQPHDNMQPWKTLTFCIATTGLFPSAI